MLRKTPLKRGTKQLKRSGFQKKTKPLLNRTTAPLRASKTGKRMIYGVKVWSMKVADSNFSLWLREKRGYTCEMCGFYDAPPTRMIQNSHYIGRSHKATRYDPENCDVFCASCHHKMEDLKQYDYRDWKIKQLGEKKHQELVERARTSLGEKDAIYKCMILLGKI